MAGKRAPGARRASDDRPLDALKEIAAAAAAGWLTGLLAFALADRAFRSGQGPGLLAAFALPVLAIVGWLVVGLRRKAAWSGQRPWARAGLALGMLVLMPAIYLGLLTARLIALDWLGLAPP